MLEFDKKYETELNKFETYHVLVVGFEEIAESKFNGNLDKTLEYFLDPETQPQSEENIRYSRATYNYLKAKSNG